MRINYIYGRLIYDKQNKHWYPAEFGYMITYSGHIMKINKAEYIYRNAGYEISMRIGRGKANKFEKLIKAANIMYWGFKLIKNKNSKYAAMYLKWMSKNFIKGLMHKN